MDERVSSEAHPVNLHDNQRDEDDDDHAETVLEL